MQLNITPNFNLKTGEPLTWGEFRLFHVTNRATCACPNPSANLVGVMQAGAKPKGIGFPMLFFF